MTNRSLVHSSYRRIVQLSSVLFAFSILTGSTLAADVKSLLDGGRPVEIQEFPWLVGIVNKTTEKLFCGGSILTKYHILTAGRCVHEWFNDTTTQRIEPNSISVIAGDGNRMEDEGTESRFQVLEIHVHSGFTYDETYNPQRSSKNTESHDGQGFQNDLAILILSTPINFTDSIKPIKISGQLNPNAQESLTFVSWGITDKKQNTIPTGKVLKMDTIDYYLDAEKSGNFGLYPKGDTIQFNSGIGGNKGLMGRCIGDPGGAVLCEEIGQSVENAPTTTKNYVLCGVVTFGIWCDRHYPTGRSTNMHFFEDWVNSITSSALWAYLTLGGILFGIVAFIAAFAIIKRRKTVYQV